MLDNWLMPQLNEDRGSNYIFQQGGCLAHYHKHVRGILCSCLCFSLIFNCIITAVDLIDRDMLTHVGILRIISYHIDVCRIGRGGKIEHL
ncbi:hypothetical protein ANN_16497 [Periplaneta americana]|uniref:Uncharacterized protein n=1 Tax=Periplaneta americana TaxID=6978 RepID=A0ABQ8SQJ8_PERAM|nr:hypothetical protein ANN_16497 [Periplaneta americana]